MSRIAIHSRPIAPRTRFLAKRPITRTIPRQSKYLATGDSTGKPKMLIELTLTEPDDEPFVTHFTRLVNQSIKNCAASVATAKYRPRIRKLGIPNKMPAAMAHKPPPTSDTISGMPSKRECKLKAA